MGRCGRTRTTTTNTINMDYFDMNVQLQSFVYMIERIFNAKLILDNEENDLLEQIITRVDLVKFQVSNLIEVAQIIYLNLTTCWHQTLEEKSVFKHSIQDLNGDTTLSNTHSVFERCTNACPSCLQSYTLYIKPVSRIGLTRFIVYTFILSQSGIVTPSILVQKLGKFKDVGIIVYKKRVATAPNNQILTSTVMQLIASEILILKSEEVEDREICTLTLNVINEYGRLSYEEDSYWEGLLIV